jgi:hypothetical protein
LREYIKFKREREEGSSRKRKEGIKEGRKEERKEGRERGRRRENGRKERRKESWLMTHRV